MCALRGHSDSLSKHLFSIVKLSLLHKISFVWWIRYWVIVYKLHTHVFQDIHVLWTVGVNISLSMCSLHNNFVTKLKVVCVYSYKHHWLSIFLRVHLFLRWWDGLLFLHQGTKLYTAARQGNLTKVKNLVAKGADINFKHKAGVSVWDCTAKGYLLHWVPY